MLCRGSAFGAAANETDTEAVKTEHDITRLLMHDFIIYLGDIDSHSGPSKTLATIRA